MSKKRQTKEDLQRVITQLQSGLATAVEKNRSWSRIKEKQDVTIDELRAKMDEAQGLVDSLRTQLDTSDQQVQNKNQALESLKKDYHMRGREINELNHRIGVLHQERDRARAALVEASMNASRLVEAVEPRTMTNICG